MSLFEKYNEPSVHFGHVKDHMHLIANYEDNEIIFEHPACYSESKTDEFEHTNVLCIDSNEADKEKDTRVKITINNNYHDFSDIYVDVWVKYDNADLIQWLISFQNMTGQRWVLNNKKYYLFAYDAEGVDEDKIQKWKCDYFDMVRKGLCMDERNKQVSIITYYKSAKYNNFMRWLKHGETEYGIKSTSMNQYRYVRFCGKMTTVDHGKEVVNDWLVDYGLTWLTKSNQKYNHNFMYELSDDPEIVKIRTNDKLLEYTEILWKWTTNEWNIYGAWFTNNWVMYEIERKIREDEDNEQVRIMRSMYFNCR